MNRSNVRLTEGLNPTSLNTVGPAIVANSSAPALGAKPSEAATEESEPKTQLLGVRCTAGLGCLENRTADMRRQIDN